MSDVVSEPNTQPLSQRYLTLHRLTSSLFIILRPGPPTKSVQFKFYERFLGSPLHGRTLGPRPTPTSTLTTTEEFPICL